MKVAFLKKNIINPYSKLILLIFLVLLLYFPIFPNLLKDWIHDSDNSHCILVPFISIFFIWRDWGKKLWQDIYTNHIGLVILIFSLIIYILGYAGGIYILPRLAMIGTIIGLVIYNLGSNAFRSLRFPILFLIFAIPIPYSIIKLVSLPLQNLVTIISRFFIGEVLSFPVLREGNMLFFAEASLEVVEACSGIRSMMAFLMLGFLFAHIVKGSSLIKALFIASAIPMAVFINLIRVTGTGILAHYFGEGIAQGFLHDFSGFAVFIAGLFLMMCLWKIFDFIENVKR